MVSLVPKERIDCPYVKVDRKMAEPKRIVCHTLIKLLMNDIDRVATTISNKTGIQKVTVHRLMPFQIYKSYSEGTRRIVNNRLVHNVVLDIVLKALNNLYLSIAIEGIKYDENDKTVKEHIDEYISVWPAIKYLFEGKVPPKMIKESLEFNLEHAEEVKKLYKATLKWNVQDVDTSKVYGYNKLPPLEKIRNMRFFIWEIEKATKIVSNTMLLNKKCEEFVEKRLNGYHATMVYTSDPIFQEFRDEILRIDRLTTRPNPSLTTLAEFIGIEIYKQRKLPIWEVFHKRYFKGQHLIICIPPDREVLAPKDIVGHVIGKHGKLAKALKIKVISK